LRGRHVDRVADDRGRPAIVPPTVVGASVVGASVVETMRLAPVCGTWPTVPAILRIAVAVVVAVKGGLVGRFIEGAAVATLVRRTSVDPGRRSGSGR